MNEKLAYKHAQAGEEYVHEDFKSQKASIWRIPEDK